MVDGCKVELQLPFIKLLFMFCMVFLGLCFPWSFCIILFIFCIWLWKNLLLHYFHVHLSEMWRYLLNPEFHSPDIFGRFIGSFKWMITKCYCISFPSYMASTCKVNLYRRFILRWICTLLSWVNAFFCFVLFDLSNNSFIWQNHLKHLIVTNITFFCWTEWTCHFQNNVPF